ncbi:unnamed protein product, partial [Medioppia subpectinata]
MKNFIDFYANEYEITYNTIDLIEIQEKIMSSQNKCKNKNDFDSNDISSDGNYKRQFIEMSAIGSGGFGTVFKVKHRLDDKMYAIKRVQFEDFSEEKRLTVLNEAKSLAKLDSDFVVKYYHSWLESNHLFIQMEFCSQNLKTILENKAIVFERQPEDQMNNVFEYFISCEIFKELLECVQYLHESKPPVIHRDLKPDNILIDSNINSNRILKLCDFGLAKESNTNGQTFSNTVVGTSRYMAPEVFSGKYNHKSDIYSLNIIGGQFSQSFNENESLKSCKLCIYETLLAMMSTPFWRQRPECRQVLAKYNEWSIDKTFIKDHKEFNSERDRFGKSLRSSKYPTKIRANDCDLSDNSSDDIYKRQFIEISTIGSGGFGTVFQVKHRLDDKMYAIKRVQFGEKRFRILNEVKMLSKMDSDFVVKYYHSWLDSNHLFIQMEFCSQNLKTILENKAIVFERQPEDQMNSVFEYFISCEIFRELLECVQYLHELVPPVIHRDLKPDNILIDPNFRSN